MIILLCGTSDIGRRMLAEKIVREKKDWKHLPLERVDELTREQNIGGEKDDMFIRIACHCAKEMGEQGYHVVLSHPTGLEEIELMREEFGPGFIGFHLGAVDSEVTDERIEELFDYLIDSGRHSVNDAYTLMMQVVDEE